MEKNKVKQQGDILTPKWLEIKKIFKENTNGNEDYGSNFEIGGELDQKCDEFIDILGIITKEYGYDVIVENVKMDLWKERVWSVVIKAGLLPPLPEWLKEDNVEKERKLREENQY